MITWQDLVAVGANEDDRAEFVRKVINDHKSSDLYRNAVLAKKYDRHENVTIHDYQKLLYTISGKAVPDNISANYKIGSNFLNIFTTQQNQYLLGNGVKWTKKDTIEKLGEDFDTQLQTAGKKALLGGVSFGFFNNDHLEVFDVLEFAPMYDEETGALKAGVRYWQIDSSKPIRATLYEIDGYTEYIWGSRTEKDGLFVPKRTYLSRIQTTEADGTEIIDKMNYPSFPIVPLYANIYGQSELIGIREGIDCYDLIKSGFANDLDDASQIYWILKNSGGMGDVDLARFINRMKTVHAAVVTGDEAEATAHTMEVPYESRVALLERLEKDLYRDYMALNVYQLASGAITATQIEAAYEPFDYKSSEYEYFVLRFITGILAIAGIDDKPTFTRSRIVNTQEEIQSLVQSAMYLSPEYVTRRILSLYGDIDATEEVLKQMDMQSFESFTGAVEE